MDKYIIIFLTILSFTTDTFSQDSIPINNKILTDSIALIPEAPEVDYTEYKKKKYIGLSLLCGGIITTSAGVITLYSLNHDTKEKTRLMTYDETIKDANDIYRNAFLIFAIIAGSGITITGSNVFAKYHHKMTESKLAICTFYSEEEISFGVILKW